MLAVSPDPNGQYPPGQEFTLTISSGKSNVDVPNVVTQTFRRREADARAGRLPGRATFGNDPNAAEGTVLKQTVKAGTKAPKGTHDHADRSQPSRSRPTPPTSEPTETPTTTPSTPTITIPGG